VPQVGSRVPLFGNALAYRPDPKAYLAKCREQVPPLLSLAAVMEKRPQSQPTIKQYGDVFELKLGSLRNVVLLGSEHSKLFFRAGEDLLSFEKALKVSTPLTLCSREPLDNKKEEMPRRCSHITPLLCCLSAGHQLWSFS